MSIFDEILIRASKKGASDIHLKSGMVPYMRVSGKLIPVYKDADIMDAEDMATLFYNLLNEWQKREFTKNKEVDLGYSIKGLGRFRIHVHQQRGSIAMVLRRIQNIIPSLDELHLPPILGQIAENERGLILVTGITGSGKSTSLASMLSHINTHLNRHIVTIEDPIEYLIPDQNSIVTQRELGSDAKSFSHALRASLRQDPDVIMIGEMRDQETVETALLAAETGHLVFSTLHSATAVDAIGRILSVFPPHQHQHVRIQLASVLKAIVAQRLVHTSISTDFIPALEILLNNERLSEKLREAADPQELLQIMEESTNLGMQTFDNCLMDYIKKKKISYEEALRASSNPSDFELRYHGVNKINPKENKVYNFKETLHDEIELDTTAVDFDRTKYKKRK